MRPFQFYFVSTPIGNLEDISARAVSTLRSVDFLLAEDTRKTRILLARHGIDVPLRPYHDFNKEKVIGSIVESLKGGKTGALVSDAGTPCVSDPGFFLARRLIDEGIEFTSLPGASAVTTALVLSGLPPDRFAFFGYLPKKKGAIEKVLLEAGSFTGTSIFFESPHRIVKALEAVSELLGDREVAVAREMTKLHEEVLRGTAEEVARILGAKSGVKGEITLLIKGTGKRG